MSATAPLLFPPRSRDFSFGRIAAGRNLRMTGGWGGKRISKETKNGSEIRKSERERETHTHTHTYTQRTNFFKTKNKSDLAPYLDRPPFRLEVKNEGGEGEKRQRQKKKRKSRAQDTAGNPR